MFLVQLDTLSTDSVDFLSKAPSGAYFYAFIRTYF